MADRKLTLEIELGRGNTKGELGQFKADMAKTNAELLANTQQTEDKIAAADKAANDARVAQARQADEKIKGVQRDALGRFVKGNRDAEDSIGKVGDRGKLSFGLIAAAAVGAIHTVRTLAGLAADLAGNLGRAGDKSRQLSEGFAGQRDRLREIAQQQGRELDNAFTIEFAKFNKETGLRASESEAFQTQFYNSGAQFEGKTLTKSEFDEFKKLSAQYTAAKGLEPSVAGDLAGSFLGLKDYAAKTAKGELPADKQAEQAAADLNATIAILQRGKGETPVLARQMAMASAALLNEDQMKGVFQSPQELASVVSTAAEFHDAAASEQIRAAVRGLRDFSGDAGPLLKKAGVGPETPFTEAIAKIAPIVQEQAAKTPGMKTEDVLGEYFKDHLTKAAIAVQINRGLGENGVYADRAKVGQEAGTFEATKKIIDNFMTSDTGRERTAEADVALAQHERAAENSELNILRKQALAKLVRDKAIDTNATNIQDYLNQKVTFGAIGTGEQKRIDEEVQRMLIARSPVGTEKGAASDLLNVSPLAREEDLRNRIGRVKKAGGKPLDERSGEDDFIRGNRDKGVIFDAAAMLLGPQDGGFAAPVDARAFPRPPAVGAPVPARPAAPGANAAAPGVAPGATPGQGMTREQGDKLIAGINAVAKGLGDKGDGKRAVPAPPLVSPPPAPRR